MIERQPRVRYATIWRRAVGPAALLVPAVLLVAPAAIPAPSKGVGPVKEVRLGPIDRALAGRGKEIFDVKCAACHKLDERYVGPAQNGVTKRRSPEWIMNMILNPQGMLEKDPTAKELLGEYMSAMPFQDVSQQDARALLEFFRANDAASGQAPAPKTKQTGAPGAASTKPKASR